MIRLQDLTPEVYYSKSRDFQLIGRLFDLVLNSVKTEADILFNLPLSTESPDQLLNLMSTTFGLRLDPAKYTSAQLRAICSIAPKLMKNKGSLLAIKYLITALLNADKATDDFLIEVDKTNPYNLIILLPTYSEHHAILDEILPYILPAGVTYRLQPAFIHQSDATKIYNVESEIASSYRIVPGYSNDVVAFSGLTEADLFNLNEKDIDEASLDRFSIGNFINTGLISTDTLPNAEKDQKISLIDAMEELNDEQE